MKFGLFEPDRFLGMLSAYKIRRLVLGWESVSATLMTVLVAVALRGIPPKDSANTFLNLVKSFSSTLLSSDASILGFVIAGLAILISLANFEFTLFLQKHDLFERITFRFYLAGVFWGLNALLAMLALFLASAPDPPFQIPWTLQTFALALVWTFTFALVLTVRLLGTSIRFGKYHHQAQILARQGHRPATAVPEDLKSWGSRQMQMCENELASVEEELAVEEKSVILHTEVMNWIKSMKGEARRAFEDQLQVTKDLLERAHSRVQHLSAKKEELSRQHRLLSDLGVTRPGNQQ